MSQIVRPGSGLLFMKVGVHAQEGLDDIIARKTREINEAGIAMWGYGGNTCHPKTMVQPFAQSHYQEGNTIYLCMEEIESKHFAEPVRADQFSVDGLGWQDVPQPINVLGSRYALVIKSLERDSFSLPLSATRVAVGKSRGVPGGRYIQGRVDKACLEIVHPVGEANPEDKVIQIGLVAELASPYAVFLRNIPKG